MVCSELEASLKPQGNKEKIVILVWEFEWFPETSETCLDPPLPYTTAYFGLLRASEFCCPTKSTFSPSSSLLVEDVKLNTNSITVTLKVSKSDPYRNGHQIRFTRTGKSICPYRALQKHIENCLDTGKPLFAFYSGKFLTRQLFTSIPNDLLRPTSFAEKYSSHSFRIGAATAAASSETPEWLLKHIGRWSSSCYQRYIRTPEQAIRMVQKKLATSQVAIWILFVSKLC